MSVNKLSQHLGRCLHAMLAAEKQGDSALERDWADEINDLVRNFMPSGSGFDRGTTINLDRSTPSKLVFHTGFHHMSEHGFYTGWTDHVVTVQATFAGDDIKVSGRNKNDIKDYIAETFQHALDQMIEFSWSPVDGGKYYLA